MQQYDALISLLTQVPLVGVFIWFVLQMMTRWEKSLEKRDAEWRRWLEEQRTAQNNTLEMHAQAVNNVATQMEQVRTALVSHDARIMSVLEMERK